MSDRRRSASMYLVQAHLPDGERERIQKDKSLIMQEGEPLFETSRQYSRSSLQIRDLRPRHQL